jgi:hypothetical protein
MGRLLAGNPMRRRPFLFVVPTVYVLLAAAETPAVRADDTGPMAPSPAVPASPTPPVPAPAPADPTAQPKIRFDRTEHDYGSARQNEKKTTTFKVSNVGGATLHVSVRGDCGCTGVTISREGPGGPKADLEPGQDATISVTFDTFRFVGPLTKSIHVMSDDPAARETGIKLKIDVSAGIVLAPQHFFFNMVLAGAKPTSTVEVKWRDGIGKTFKITSVDTTEMRLNGTPTDVKPEFKIEPFDAAPWHGYKVTMHFSEPPPIGMLTGNAILKTDDPDTPKLSALVGGSVSGKVVISQVRTSFGMVEQGKGAMLSVLVRPFDATIDLGKVTATSQKGLVKVRMVNADEPQMKGVWKLEVELPKDAAIGAVDDVIDLTTEVKGEEKTTISVSGTVVGK